MICGRCKKEFAPRNKRFRNCSPECSEALNKHAQVKWRKKSKGHLKAKNHKYNALNATRIKRNRYRVRYGITPESAQAMLGAQGYRCAICGKPLEFGGSKGRSAPTIDHCHVTKRVRGILCTPCNLLLGYSKDDTAVLEAAILYLKGPGYAHPAR